jgi:hypothetical protein
VVAMGAVFASAARAPLTSLASVVEMTGDFALTLPVMLAVAIAATISRALSYGTIYTTKLLRRGTDIDRTTPWRALSDLKVAQAMRPFRPPLPVPPADGGSDGTVPARESATVAEPVVYRGDPQALFGTESLAQTLRQLEVYGHDGLPVLSPARSPPTSLIPPRPSSPPTGTTPTRTRSGGTRRPRCPVTRSLRSPSPPTRPPPGASSATSPGPRAALPYQSCAATGSARPARRSSWPRAIASAC